MPDYKQQLIRSLKTRNVKGYHFSLQEDEKKVVAALTNSAILKLIDMDRLGPELTLSYTWVKDKEKRTTKTYRSEAIRKGSSLAILVRDLGTNKVISKASFPPSVEDDHNGSPEMNTIAKCQQEFLCKYGGEMQCEANRTCKDQWYSLICWFDNGNGVSIHGVIKPNTHRCQIVPNIPPLEGVVFSRSRP